MSIQWRAAEEAQNGHRSNQQPSNRQGTKWCSVSRKPRRQRALHASRAAESTLVRKHGQPTNRAPRPAAEKPVSSMRTKLTLKQACFQGYPESTVYVQIPVGSRNSAIHNAYHTSLRPSSLFEPRHPSLKVVIRHSTSTVNKTINEPTYQTPTPGQGPLFRRTPPIGALSLRKRASMQSPSPTRCSHGKFTMIYFGCV